MEPNQFEFEFEDDGRVLFQTKPMYFYTTTHTYKFICQETELLDDNVEEKQICLQITFENSKYDILVYSPYMLVNKTEQRLYFGEKDSKKDNLV